jgi:hypothetical protein
MSDIAIFLVGVGLTLLTTALVVFYFRPHLHRILLDLCGTEDRARFWTAFSNITLLLIPLIFAMSYRPKTGELFPIFFELSNQFKWGLVGLVSSIVVTGFMISRFVPPTMPPSPPQSEAKKPEG